MSVIQITPPKEATFPSIRKWFTARWAQLHRFHLRRRQQRIDRLAFQRLLVMDEHLLDDIGYRRQDVEATNALPLGENAALALYAKSKKS